MKSVARGRGTARGGRGTPHASKPKEAAARSVKSQFPPLWLPALATLIFAGFTLLPRVNANPHLQTSFLAAAGLLLAGLCALWWSVVRTGRTLTYEFVPRRVHWVQMIMHSCVFAYWGWYWREVYHEIPLILAQVVFLYALDMLVCWSRRDNWILGFGPIPIIFSMNLFLWFRDDWFYLQFAMVAMIVLGKEFLRWKRDGQLTHIFNPSAFALFLTSIVLIATRTTPITWGAEISTTFNSPPNIYIEIFLLGLIVQALFSVTLVTLSAAAMLYVLNVAYTGSTGMYLFIDTNIHPAIFLGLHLLVTDPATSPRKNFGKAIFGAAYGAGVFALVAGRLGSAGVLRQAAMRTGAQFDGTGFGPRQHCSQRLASPAEVGYRGETPAVAGAFGLDSATGEFWIHGDLGGFFWVHVFHGLSRRKAPGQRPRLLGKSLRRRGARNPAEVLARTLDVQCQHNSASGCFSLGTLLSGGKGLPRDPIGAGRSFKHACDIGSRRRLQQSCEYGENRWRRCIARAL